MKVIFKHVKLNNLPICPFIEGTTKASMKTGELNQGGVGLVIA